MAELLTIAEVARVLDVPKPTVRNWTREFSQALSDYAKPDRGNVRRYTPDDVRALAYIRRARLDDRSVPTIHEDLALAKHREAELPDLRSVLTKPVRRRRIAARSLSSDQLETALQVLRDDHRRELERLKAENQSLQGKIREMQEELNHLRERAARAEGQLSAYRHRTRHPVE
jgi:DNA-binding transcriptional MerR regulator